MTDALKHALVLASQGFPVFPCNGNKSPACPRGFYAATNDTDKLTELFRQYPGSLLGVPTGAVSGFDVLDLDLAEHPSADEWWHGNASTLLMTRVHGTPSGGLHLFYRHAPGLRCSASKIVRGVDVRGDAGYIIFWPSAGFPVISDAPIAKWPQWLLAELLPRPKPSPPKYPTTDALNNRHLADLVKTAAHASEGQRNAILYWAACRVAERAHYGDFAAEALVAAAVRAGLPEAEARRTVQSGMRGTT